MSHKITETSLAAYRSLDPTKLSETKRQILYALSQLFVATHEEVAAFMKVDRSVVWKRMSELERDGMIFKPGIKKALRSGRAGFCYQLTSASQPRTTAAEKALKGHSIVDYSRKINEIAKAIPGTYKPATLF